MEMRELSYAAKTGRDWMPKTSKPALHSAPKPWPQLHNLQFTTIQAQNGVKRSIIITDYPSFVIEESFTKLRGLLKIANFGCSSQVSSQGCRVILSSRHS